MDLSAAVLVLKRINGEKFCQAFQKQFDKTFHINDLHFWCELTGISPKIALGKLYKQGWKMFCKEIYISSIIETIEELKMVCSLYRLQKSDIVKVVTKVVKLHKGSLFRVVEHLPLSSNVVRILLELQDELIPITPHCWFPKSNLPDTLKVLSRYAHSQQSKWDELIITTFVREGKPLRLEELIYKSMGIIPAPVTLKRMFTFMLNLLPVSKIQDTEYWILNDWETRVDIKLVDSITILLGEQGVLSPHKIREELTEYKESRIRRMLAFWPEFAECSEDRYKLNFSPMDDELLAIIVPTLLKHLAKTKKGVLVQELFKHAKIIANSHGLIIHSRDFKSFLKSWGEAAIVGNHVYSMKKAPFHEMRLGDVAYLVLKEAGSPMTYTELEAEIRKRRNYISSISSVFLSEPKLSRPSRGYWALREWGLVEYDPEIHNRIGEILISIIEQAGRPVHKTEIRRQLRRRGMSMNEGTLHIDLTENEHISQVARGVYALTKWQLSFRDLFHYKFPFTLVLPDGNPTIYELKDGIMIEYFISKYCLELGRILVKRYITEYFPNLKQYTKYTVSDISGAKYEGWVDQVGEGRYQFLGLQRWYKTHKPRYGENIYLYIPRCEELVFRLLTAEQADLWLNDEAEKL